MWRSRTGESAREQMTPAALGDLLALTHFIPCPVVAWSRKAELEVKLLLYSSGAAGRKAKLQERRAALAQLERYLPSVPAGQSRPIPFERSDIGCTLVEAQLVRWTLDQMSASSQRASSAGS